MPGGPMTDQGCHGKLTCNRAVTGCHRLSQAVTAVTAVTGCHMLSHAKRYHECDWPSKSGLLLHRGSIVHFHFRVSYSQKCGAGHPPRRPPQRT